MLFFFAVVGEKFLLLTIWDYEDVMWNTQVPQRCAENVSTLGILHSDAQKKAVTLTIVRLRLPVMLSVSEREGRVGAACEARALLRLQAAHPHVLQAMIRRGVHLWLCVHIRAHTQGVAAAVDVSGRSRAQYFILLLRMLLLLLLLVDVVVWAPHLPSLTEI